MDTPLSYFTGKNGLEYMTKADADNYGGGCVSVRTIVPDVVRDIRHYDPTKGEKLQQLQLMPLAQLKEIAKALSIQRYWLMGKDKLVDLLMECDITTVNTDNTDGNEPSDIPNDS